MKNCAFVRFVELDAALQAHTAGQQGLFVRGQNIRVGWGKNDGPPGGGGYGGGGGGGRHFDDPVTPTTKLWVGNIEQGTTEEEIRGLFSQFGTIERIKVLSQKNCAFVDFQVLDHALAAKQALNGVPFKSGQLRINFGKDDPNRDRPRREDFGGGDRGGGDRRRGGYGGGGGYRSPDRSLQPPMPPSDTSMRSIIDKLAVAVARAGPSLEDMTLKNQGSNPMFAFLKDDHEHNLYYRFRIFEIKNPGVVRNALSSITFRSIEN
jgi:RNA recognition motif-containing protein